MIGERGVRKVKCNQSIEQIQALTDKFWSKNLFNMADVIDIGLLSEELRQEYASIGSESISQDVIDFVFSNIHWINICLYVNADFREAVYDSITIEQAISEVDEDDYIALREDMRIASLFQSRSQSKYSVNIDMPLPGGDVQRFVQSIGSSAGEMQKFKLEQIYRDLQSSLSGDVLNQVVSINSNMVYALNAFDKNDILFKYVQLVVTNVRNILSK